MVLRLKMGAILAGKNESCQSKIYDFGKKLGLAFQLQDDILDIFSDETGKQKGGDILENKKTLPILIALDKINISEKQEFQRLLDSKDENKVEKVIDVLTELEVRKICEKFVEQYSNEAILSLHSIEELATKERFLDFHDTLMQRTY